MTSLGVDFEDNLSANAVVLKLHEIENSLSSLVAMNFWIGEYSLSLGLQLFIFCKVGIYSLILSP
jgi:hypothetical protein